MIAQLINKKLDLAFHPEQCCHIVTQSQDEQFSENHNQTAKYKCSESWESKVLFSTP